MCALSAEQCIHVRIVFQDHRPWSGPMDQLPASTLWWYLYLTTQLEDWLYFPAEFTMSRQRGFKKTTNNILNPCWPFPLFFLPTMPLGRMSTMNNIQKCGHPILPNLFQFLSGCIAFRFWVKCMIFHSGRNRKPWVVLDIHHLRSTQTFDKICSFRTGKGNKIYESMAPEQSRTRGLVTQSYSCRWSNLHELFTTNQRLDIHDTQAVKCH